MYHSLIKQSVHWIENAKPMKLPLLSYRNLGIQNATLIKDGIRAMDAIKLMQADQNMGLIWTGKYHQVKTLLDSMKRSIDKTNSFTKTHNNPFLEKRRVEMIKAQMLNRLLIPVSQNSRISLSNAPDYHEVIKKHYDDTYSDFLIPLRELLGMVGADQWEKRGIFIPQLENKIYPYYSVYAPVRKEYLDVFNEAASKIQNPFQHLLEVGTGTGVLTAILLKQGLVRMSTGTDINPAAVKCSKDNLKRLGLECQSTIIEANLFPSTSCSPSPDLIICNPPWIPSAPSSPMDLAIFDENGQLLKAFLANVLSYLSPEPHARVWLLLSDFPELAQLRPSGTVESEIAKAGLSITEIYCAKPFHPKASCESHDRLSSIRQQEITRLYVLARNAS